MKLSLVALSAAIIATVAVTVARERSRLSDQVDALMGGGAPTEHAQLMRMGRVSGPDIGSAGDADGTTQELAQVDDDRTGAGADAGSGAVEVAQAVQDPPTSGVPQPADNAAPAAPVAQGTAAPDPATAAASTEVDESALRYFASRGDKVRLQAEISRLRALYPNWTPPADPLSVPQNKDGKLEAMWQLYAEAHYAELRKAIADRQIAEQGWQPPADLVDRLNVAEARTRLVNASDLKQYQTVVDVAATTPSLLTCSDIDVLWRVADAFGNSDRVPRARDAYLYILQNCENPAERLATVQKASALLPYGMMQDLLARERPASSGTAREFDSLRDDLSRRFVGEANVDPNLAISPTYLSRVEQLAQTKGLASDALLLGWYYIRREDMASAEKWFRAAFTKENSASAAQGLALTLIARKAPQEAEDILYKWRDSSPEATAAYLAATANLLALDPPPTLAAEVLQRIAASTLSAHDTPTAQQFGWYARAQNQPQAAAQWFETALRWKPDDEPSAYGLAITRALLGDKAGVAEVQRLWSGRSDRILHLGETEVQTERNRKPLPPPTASPGVDTNTTGDVQPNVRRVILSQPAAPVAAAPIVAAPVLAAPSPVATAVAPRQPAPVRVARQTRPSTAGCATTVDPETLSPAAALPRAWCLMNINRPIEAAAAFDMALRSTDQHTRQEASYGQSLAYLRLGLTSQAAASAAKAPLDPQRALDLQTAILSNRATNAFGMKRYREAIIYLDQLRQLKPERIDLMLLRGYAYQQLRRFSDAIRIFEAAADTGNTEAIRALTYAREAQAAPVN